MNEKFNGQRNSSILLVALVAALSERRPLQEMSLKQQWVDLI
jgi:hypothetical protein